MVSVQSPVVPFTCKSSTKYLTPIWPYYLDATFQSTLEYEAEDSSTNKRKRLRQYYYSECSPLFQRLTAKLIGVWGSLLKTLHCQMIPLLPPFIAMITFLEYSDFKISPIFVQQSGIIVHAVVYEIILRIAPFLLNSLVMNTFEFLLCMFPGSVNAKIS